MMLILNIYHQPFETLFRSKQRDEILLYYMVFSSVFTSLVPTPTVSRQPWLVHQSLHEAYVQSDVIIIMHSVHTLSAYSKAEIFCLCVIGLPHYTSLNQKIL